MSKPKKYDTSLAFVDVITNGLGGMLILFFIVVLLQTQLEWVDRSEASDVTPRRDSEPFVLIVTAKDGGSPFNAESSESLWQFTNVTPGAIQTERGVQSDWGASYAVFVSNKPLGLNSSARLRTDGVEAAFNVDVYPAGAQKRAYEVKSVQGNQWTEVWPAFNAR